MKTTTFLVSLLFPSPISPDSILHRSNVNLFYQRYFESQGSFNNYVPVTKYYQGTNQGNVRATQTVPLFTQKSWDQFADEPLQLFFLFKEDGTLQRFVEDSNYVYDDSKV